MKAFVAAVFAIAVIAVVAAFALDTLPSSAADKYSSPNVRLQ